MLVHGMRSHSWACLIIDPKAPCGHRGMSPTSEHGAGSLLEWEQSLKLLRSGGRALGWKLLSPESAVWRNVLSGKRKDG